MSTKERGKRPFKLKIISLWSYFYRLRAQIFSKNPSASLKLDKRDNVKQLLSRLLPSQWTFYDVRSDKESGYNARVSKSILKLFLLSVFRTYLTYRSTKIALNLTRAIYGKNGKSRKMAFKNVMLKGLLVMIFGSLTTSTYSYVKKRLSMTWRRQLSDTVHHAYFKKKAYYYLASATGKGKIKNPGHLISNEISSQCEALVDLISMIIEAAPPLVLFTTLLYRRHGLKFAILPHCYLLLAYEIVQRSIPCNYGEVYRNAKVAEGTFGAATARLQRHSEAIAALNGIELEKSLLNNCFNKVQENNYALARTKGIFNLVINLGYQYNFRPFITAFVMLPVMTASKSSTGQKVAHVQSSIQTMIAALVAFGQFLTFYAKQFQMQKNCYLINKLITALKTIEHETKQRKESSLSQLKDEILFNDVQVSTPTGRLLVDHLNFSIKSAKSGNCRTSGSVSTTVQNQSLLLTGHNGAGKSSIFRCLGGLWGIQNGEISKPDEHEREFSNISSTSDIFYLPQKPYNVVGTLKEQLAYPNEVDEKHLTDITLKEYLNMVNLSYLIGEMEGDLKKQINWDDRLSLGEMQRLAIARLLYHNPKFAILDECTSAVTKEIEELLYTECIKRKIVYITICHRPALKKYHERNLNLLGNGEWEMRQLPKMDCLASDSKISIGATKIQETKKYDQQENESKIHKYETIENKRMLPKRSTFSKFKKLLSIVVPGSTRGIALMFAGILLHTILREVFDYLQGLIFQKMIRKDVQGFAKLSILLWCQDILTCFVSNGVKHLQNVVGIKWHKSLNDYVLNLYVKNKSYYSLSNTDGRIKDASQRISYELANLSKQFADIWSESIVPLLDIIWFTGKLQLILGTQGTKWIYSFVFLNTLWSRYCVPDYNTINTKLRELESGISFIHNRIVEHAESIAFFKGGEAEKKKTITHFNKLTKHMEKSSRSQWISDYINFLVCKPASKHGPSSILWTPDLFNFFMQYIHANLDHGHINVMDRIIVKGGIARVVDALSSISSLYENLSNVLGSSTRVCELIDVLEEINANATCGTDDSITKHSDGGSDIILSNVDLITPTGTCLAKSLSVTVTPSEPLLVTGPNASGKSSLFRILAGLWPTYRNGKILPTHIKRSFKHLFLVPQRV